jgi:hypothetical protein
MKSRHLAADPLAVETHTQATPRDSREQKPVIAPLKNKRLQNRLSIFANLLDNHISAGFSYRSITNTHRLVAESAAG